MDIKSVGNETWRQFRQIMPVTRKWAYFDNAAVAPLPNPTRDSILTWAREATEEGDTVWPQWARRVEETRQYAAEMINARTQEIALVPNTTSGISAVAEGLPWRDGDNMVTLANEFPSNVYPWMNLESRGVEVRRVPVDGVAVDLNKLAEACDARTRLVSISWVGFSTGWRIDVEQLSRLAHAHDALFLLDAIQGLGVFPLDVQQTEVDFVAADGHKWMLGPEGAGMLYIRSEHLGRLRPIGVGWNSVKHHHDYGRIEFDIRSDAARYEGGSQNMAGMLGFGASLRTLAQLGLTPKASPIASRIFELTGYACQRLRDIGATIVSDQRDEHRSGIVAFDTPGKDHAEQRKRCMDKNVVLSCRAGHLRISPHAYANEEDIDRMIDVLK